MLRIEDARVGQRVKVTAPYPDERFVGMTGTIIRIYPERGLGQHPFDIDVPAAGDWFVFASNEIDAATEDVTP